MRFQRFSSGGTLVVVCLATAMLMLDIAVVNTALPKIATDLHSGLTGIQWIVDAYTLALATVVLTAGSIADRIGRRLVFAGGMGLFTATSLACALASNIAVLDALGNVSHLAIWVMVPGFVRPDISVQTRILVVEAPANMPMS